MPLKNSNKLPQTVSERHERFASTSAAPNIEHATQQPDSEQSEQPKLFHACDMENIGVPHPNTVRALLHAGSETHVDSEAEAAEHIVWGSVVSDTCSSMSASLRSAKYSNSTEQSRTRRRSANPTQHNQVVWHLQSLDMKSKEVHKLEKLKIPLDDISVSIDDDVFKTEPQKEIDAANTQGPPVEPGILPSRASQPREPLAETCAFPSWPMRSQVAHMLPETKQLQEEQAGEPCASGSSWLTGSVSPITQAGESCASGSNESMGQLQKELGHPARQKQIEDDQKDHTRDGTLEREFNEVEERRLQHIAQEEFMEAQRPNLQLLRQGIPRDQKGAITSIGSIGHPAGECKPCVHIMCKTQCPNFIDCSFCHFPHRKPGKPKKLGKNERYRKLVESFVCIYENDPDKFSLDSTTLPVSMKASQAAIERLRSNIRERVEARLQIRLMEALSDLDTGCLTTQIITARGTQTTLALVSL